jgi:Flp pilus assembly protein TadG
MPLVLALLLGTVSAGVAYSHKLSINNAVREGARYGATVPQSQCTPVSTCANRNWAQLVRAVAVTRSDGALSTSQVCVALVSGSGAAPVAVGTTFTTAGGTSPCYVDNSPDTGMRVQVTATRQDAMQFVVFHRTVNVTGKATARFEQ